MPVVLTDKDKGKKFFIDLGDGSGSEGVYVVPQTDSDRDKMRRHFTERKVTRSGIQEQFDSAGFFHARLKQTIKDWVGFVDIEGNPISCTPENIVECAEMNSMLFIEILSNADRLAESGKAVTEKNSETGRNGASKTGQ
jgi:hypothetical protein